MSEIITLKCVLLGETAVGKSSLIYRFVNGTFKSQSHSTIVGCYSSKEVVYKEKDITIIYELWDTAGQEKFRAINRIFYQDAKIILLVYDVTEKSSFEALKDYWYNEIKENSPSESIIIIVGNKYDMFENEEVNEDDVNNYCKNINVLFQKTSAQSGEGVRELFDMIGEQVLTQANFEGFREKKNKVIVRNENKKFGNSKYKKKKKCC